MDATTWIKLRPEKRLSWHIDVTAAPAIAANRWTRCGRWADADAPRADDLPAGERSCENCLRLDKRDRERA